MCHGVAANTAVVPAQAGTHTPRRKLVCAMEVDFPSTTSPCGYGSRPSPGRRSAQRQSRCRLELADRLRGAQHLDRRHPHLARGLEVDAEVVEIDALLRIDLQC